jgi:hypothetical protein
MSSSKSEMADASPSVHCGDAHAWRAAGLLPLLLQAPPRHALQAAFDKHSKKHAKGGINSIHAGEVLDLAKLSAPPELEWPLDSDEPDAKWTVACVRRRGGKRIDGSEKKRKEQRGADAAAAEKREETRDKRRHCTAERRATNAATRIHTQQQTVSGACNMNTQQRERAEASEGESDEGRAAAGSDLNTGCSRDHLQAQLHPAASFKPCQLES